jgi:uncharacterized membrane protein
VPDWLLLAAWLVVAVAVVVQWRRDAVPARRARTLGGAAFVWLAYGILTVTGSSVPAETVGVVVGIGCLLAGVALGVGAWLRAGEGDGDGDGRPE